MRCDRYRDNVGPLIDGEISSEERGATIAHLNGCPTCAAEYQRLQDLRRRLLVARVPLPRSLVHRVRARIASEAAGLDSRPQRAPMTQTLVALPSRVGRMRPWLRQAAVI